MFQVSYHECHLREVFCRRIAVKDSSFHCRFHFTAAATGAAELGSARGAPNLHAHRMTRMTKMLYASRLIMELLTIDHGCGTACVFCAFRVSLALLLALRLLQLKPCLPCLLLQVPTGTAGLWAQDQIEVVLSVQCSIFNFRRLAAFGPVFGCIRHSMRINGAHDCRHVRLSDMYLCNCTVVHK